MIGDGLPLPIDPVWLACQERALKLRAQESDPPDSGSAPNPEQRRQLAILDAKLAEFTAAAQAADG